MITLWIHWKQSCVLLLIFIHSIFFWFGKTDMHDILESCPFFKFNPLPNVFSAACPSHWLTHLIPSIIQKRFYNYLYERWMSSKYFAYAPFMQITRVQRVFSFSSVVFIIRFSLLKERCFENWWPHEKWEHPPRSAQGLLALRWWRIWFCCLNPSLGEIFSWGVWKPAHSLSPLF